MKFFAAFVALVAVASAAPQVSTWTLEELDAAISDPNTSVYLRPYLIDALNTMMDALWSGHQISAVPVVTPIGVAPSPSDAAVIPAAAVEPVGAVVPVAAETVAASPALIQIIINVNAEQQSAVAEDLYAPAESVSPAVDRPIPVEQPIAISPVIDQPAIVAPVIVVDQPTTVTPVIVVDQPAVSPIVVVDQPAVSPIVVVDQPAVSPIVVVDQPAVSPIVVVDQPAVSPIVVVDQPAPINPIDVIAIGAPEINPVDIISPIPAVSVVDGGILVR